MRRFLALGLAVWSVGCGSEDSTAVTSSGGSGGTDALADAQGDVLRAGIPAGDVTLVAFDVAARGRD